MYPSERYADVIKVLPTKKRQKVAEYVDEAYQLADPVTTYGVRSWKQLVQHLVEFESGTPYLTDRSPIADYLLYWKELENA